MIEIALAYNGNSAVGLTGFIPFILMQIPFAIVFRSVAERKGRYSLDDRLGIRKLKGPAYIAAEF